MEEDEDAKVVFGIQKRICRCCLNSSKSTVYAASVREAFFELAGITVDTSDGLPQWICTQCLTLLKKALRFRSKIIHTDNVLREYLSRCAPFPIDESDPELSKYASPHLSQTQILQFDTEKSKNGYHKVLQHVKPMAAVYDVECKMEYDEPVIKLEHDYSDVEDDLPLLELRSNKEDSLLEDDVMVRTTSKPAKRKKDSKSRKKKKKYQNESESDDESESDNESENPYETYNDAPTLEPLESNDPLASQVMTDLEKIEITDEHFRTRIKKNIQLNYLRSYKDFISWKEEKNITDFTEKVFLTYFNELDLKYKPSTLVNIYSKLKATLLALKGISMSSFAKLRKFLRDRTKSHYVAPYKVFKKSEIDRFLKTAPDDHYLSVKVVLIFGACSGCTTHELLKLTVKDIEIHENLIIVKVQDQGIRERSFMVPENYSEHVKKYINLRPKDLEFDRFFVNYKDGVCTKIVMGKNKISTTPKEVALFLKLKNPERYTGHGLRRTFNALFDPKKGPNGYIESESDSESESDAMANRDDVAYDNADSFNDDMANSSDLIANSNDNMANSSGIASFDDNIANSSDEIANPNDNMANSSAITASIDDNTANSTDEIANSNDKTANSIYEDGVKMPSGRILKLPEKSAKSYVRAYEMFTNWMQKKSINNVTEDVMIDYFKHLSLEFRPSSLWNVFSMLRNTILTQNGVDIKKFDDLKQFLRCNIEGFERKISKVFTIDEIDMFLSSAPDYNYLAMKVVLILGISGACTGQELTNLTTNNVQLHNNNIVVKIKDGHDKQRRFYVQARYCDYVRRYMNLRPNDLGHNRFFFPINNSNYTKQVIGKNTVGRIPREVASYLVLPNPEDYNGHCFKRTSIALFGPNRRTCESQSESESESNSESEVHVEPTIQIENIKSDSVNESLYDLQIDYEPSIERGKFENRCGSGDFQIENSNTEIEIKPINIKQEKVENTTIQDNCVYIQENSTNKQENSANTRKKSIKVQENNTNTRENSTNKQENSANTRKTSTNKQENSTKTQEKSANTRNPSTNKQENSTKTQEKSANTRNPSTNKQENSTKIQEKSANTRKNSNDTQENFTNLPKRSQKHYFLIYEGLQTWMIENDFDTYTESVLLKFFEEISKKLKPSSLCARYSMLRVTIKLRTGIDIYSYKVLREFVNKNTRGFQSKKSKVFSLKEIEKFLLEAPDNMYLHYKVALIFGISGACKCKELIELKKENVKICGKIMTVKILSKENKRKFFIKEKYVPIVKKYIDLRPDLSNNRFFLSYRNNICSKQVMGKNAIGGIAKEIAKYLNLPNPKEYTGLCFRRTSFSLFGKK